MTREIFISVTHADAGLAEALSDAMKALFGAIVKVYFSPSKELEGGIRHGEDWFDWIARHVQQCDFALILITPSSVQKPWILWEAGAVYGVAIAKGREGQRKVRPLVYQIDDAQIPSPIRESKAQFKRSDSFGDAKNLFEEIIDHFRDELTSDQLSEAFAKLDKVIESYMAQRKIVLLKSPLLELGERYLQIHIADWRERVRRKNDAASEMAKYVLEQGFPKKELASEEHEGLLLALATAIRWAPEREDIHFLLSIANKVTRLHVRHRILLAIEALCEKGYVSEREVSPIKQILEKYKFGADASLLGRIEQTDYTIRLI